MNMSSIDYTPFWDECLKQIHQEFIEDEKESEFKMWFNISYVSSHENKITASVPSSYMNDQMEIRGYKKLIKEKLLEISGLDLDLEIIVIKKNKTASSSIETETSETKVETKHSFETASKEDEEKKHHPLLNPMYTFENFVSSDENEFVYNACLASAKNPGKGYNPLLIYGGVGLGKTHLMQAIGNELYKTSNLKIIYISAENFTNEFIHSLQSKTQSQFKMKYRKADVLLIDDIHFFQGKEGTQEELFHIFNALYENNKQLVFTCDRPVSELKSMTERLRSRFQRGINTDIHMPKYEIRCAIIEHKMKLMGKTLPSEIVDLIAQNIQTNIRDLEACLNTIVSYAELTKGPFTTELAKKIIFNTFTQEASPVSIEAIQKVVAEYFNLNYSDMRSKKRPKNISFPRQVAFYLASEMTEYSTTEIGQEFGGRDHSTVMHGCQKIVDKLNSDASFEETIQILMKKIKEFKKE